MEVAAPLRQVLPAGIPEQEDLDLKETPEGLPPSILRIIQSSESMIHQQSTLMTGFGLDFPSKANGPLLRQMKPPDFVAYMRRRKRTVQLMTSLIVQSLGYFWTYLYFSQNIAFAMDSEYTPIVGTSGYSLWASLLFSLSGSFSIALQRRPSNHMLIWTMTMNILSIFATLIGVFLITLELMMTSGIQSSLWQYRSGRMLTGYLFLFTVVEMCMACIVTEWTYRARQTED
ncbi:membrane-spanning 4-domains subfamily A member 13-like [Microtus ochrogaster]|uniref:Membrane-spanning 4-domains subfamily A member 13-like n=1 Tax=Microtus ochrogaster TaxID=79684 RepID=A0ABM1AXF2_MICOH|nr:membrane-spanning 4-domains subfamily A member 13-like [Microtus ochrogaster]